MAKERTTKIFIIDGEEVEKKGLTQMEWDEKLDDGIPEETIDAKYYLKAGRDVNEKYLSPEAATDYEAIVKLKDEFNETHKDIFTDGGRRVVCNLYLKSLPVKEED